MIQNWKLTIYNSKPRYEVGEKIFQLGFPFTDTVDWQCFKEKEGVIFIPLYLFHSFMNIPTFICNFAC